MKKAALLLAAILLLMHPAAAACLVTGEAYGVGAAAAIVGRMLVPGQRIAITLVQAPFEPVPVTKLELRNPDGTNVGNCWVLGEIRLGGMLAANRISYVKWDMNRHSPALGAAAHVAHNGAYGVHRAAVKAGIVPR